MAADVFQEKFHVAQPIERVWAVLADTQRFNELFLRQPPSRVVARGPDRLRLKTRFAGRDIEYDEYPWSFEAPRHYHWVRVFSSGPLQKAETDCRLAEHEDGTLVDYTARVTMAPGVLPQLFRALYARHMRKALRAARGMIERLDGASPIPWPEANPQKDAVVARARPAVERAAERHPELRDVFARIVQHAASATEADVARMRPYELADQWRLPRDEVLRAFLVLAHGGVLRLSWDLLCPACDGAAATVGSLSEIPEGRHCDACDVDFTAGFESNVEATFQPEPVIREAQRLVFCHGSPMGVQRWLAQFVVEPGKEAELKMALGAGRYRAQAAGIRAGTLVEVGDHGDEAVRLTIERGRADDGPALPAALPVLRAGRVAFLVKNGDEVPRRLQIAHRTFASRAATAADVTALGLFRDLFGGEALSPEQHVAVGQTAILFTDLVGSTAMYERIGDAAAYGIVRRHFQVLFSAVEENRGRVVKTVGDCVMASFDRPADAVRAGGACILGLRSIEGAEDLGLKVGVHVGPCLAVEANRMVDYFGRTVNVAARVEALAGRDELVVSAAARDAIDVATVLDEMKARGAELVDDKKPVKGVAEPIEIVRVRFPRG